jgi:NADH-quinone oxidoreductase subunit G
MTTTTVAPATAPAVPTDSVSLTIDGERVIAKKGTLLVEAAKSVGNDIPVFCYHDKLKPVGACRMCLVEVEKMPRLQTACTTPVAEGMIVKTQSQMAKEGRESVVSLLLANHPLDCPVCDKGGECPLQDNTFGHGQGVSHFTEEKRHNDKAFELSERIVLDRERCILCYRCVRFHEEIPGDRALAVIDRGSHGEIGVLEGDVYDSPFQGNTIDICPVGALTSRQYRFRARPWDLQKTAGIACDDPVGSHVEIDTRDGRVLRVRGRTSEASVRGISDGWIADRTRFDALPGERSERLATPLIRRDGKWMAASWGDAVRAAGTTLRNKRVGVVAAPSLTNEAFGVLASGALGDRVQVTPASSTWQTKGSIASLANSKSIVVVGLDPWSEVPMLALWLHRAVANTAAGPGGANLVVISTNNGLFRDTKEWLKGDLVGELQGLVDALKGRGGSAQAKAAAASLQTKPSSLLAGRAVAEDPAGRALLEELAVLIGADGEAGLVGSPTLYGNGRGAQTIIGVSGIRGAPVVAAKDLDAVLIIGELPPDAAKPSVANDGSACLVAGMAARGVWMTSSLSSSPTNIPDFIDVVLPLAHLYEQAGSLTNLEGRVQGFDAAGTPPGQGPEAAKADWMALTMLANELGVVLPRDLAGLRALLFAKHPSLASIPRNRAKPRVELSIV